MTFKRDDFTKTTKDVLSKRVGGRCSNPECNVPTSGPHSDPEKHISIGIAAHITAASQNGPRYDPKLSSAQRSSIDNGILYIPVILTPHSGDTDPLLVLVILKNFRLTILPFFS